MTELRLADPGWLLLGLLGVAVVIAALLRERTALGVAFPGAGALSPGRVGVRARMRHLPVVLAGLGLVVAAVALARPQAGSVHQRVTTEGVDIVVALDVSGSMAAEDFQPRNRLTVAKTVVEDFISRRTNDRVGLVVFAGVALTKAPPTTDRGMLRSQLEDVHLDMLPDGTAVGSGMATALARLRHSKAKSRVIVLVTDGANNAGEIDPVTAADIARAMGVKVYTVGVGKGGRVPIPMRMRDPITGRTVTRTVPMNVDIDEGLLQRVADETGGAFFRATDSDSLRQIFDRIDALEKSKISTNVYRRYRELYRPFLLVAVGLLGIAAGLWAWGLRVVPA